MNKDFSLIREKSPNQGLMDINYRRSVKLVGNDLHLIPNLSTFHPKFQTTTISCLDYQIDRPLTDSIEL